VANEQDQAQETPKKGGLFKKLIILLVLLLVLGGGGFAAYQFYLKDMLFGGDDVAEAEGEAQAAVPQAGFEELVSLPTFVVNLADPLGRRYLKLSLDVEVTDQESAKDLTAKEAKVRDSVILLLSSKSYQDLSSMEAKILLKKEVAERLNQVLGGPKVLRVYITDMVVQ
jgi:flagellar FliL protein